MESDDGPTDHMFNYFKHHCKEEKKSMFVI